MSVINDKITPLNGRTNISRRCRPSGVSAGGAPRRAIWLKALNNVGLNIKGPAGADFSEEDG
jgi:hypothetical protein